MMLIVSINYTFHQLFAVPAKSPLNVPDSFMLTEM